MEVSKLRGVTVSLDTNFKGMNHLCLKYEGRAKFIDLRNEDYDACLVALHDLGARHIDE